MPIAPIQCLQRLTNGKLPRLLMLFGDEPQQKLDVTDAWRAAAKTQQYDERHSFTADSDFDWQQLLATTNTLSLFSEKQIIELHLPTGKPGTTGAATLIDWVSSESADTALLLHGPAINQSVKNTKWFKTLEQQGIFCQCYELKGQQLTHYLNQYASKVNLRVEDDALLAIADMNEGNLLAAKQEIDKLALSYSFLDTITLNDIENALSVHSRYSIFELTEAVLSGDAQRAVVILDRLEQEGTEPNAIIWQLINEAQRLEDCLQQQANTGRINFSKMRIWQSKQRYYTSAIRRLNGNHLRDILKKLADADAMFKSERIEQPFVVLAHLCLLFIPFQLTEISLV